MTTQINATHLAMYQIAWASTAAAEYAYKADGGVSLREGPLQRAFHATLAGRQHVRVSAAVGDEPASVSLPGRAQITSGVTVPQSVNESVVSTRKFEPAEWRSAWKRSSG